MSSRRDDKSAPRDVRFASEEAGTVFLPLYFASEEIGKFLRLSGRKMVNSGWRKRGFFDFGGFFGSVGIGFIINLRKWKILILLGGKMLKFDLKKETFCGL